MLSYAEMKRALKAKQENTTHFTKDFYNTYIAAQENSAMWEAVKQATFTIKILVDIVYFLKFSMRIYPHSELTFL